MVFTNFLLLERACVSLLIITGQWIPYDSLKGVMQFGGCLVSTEPELKCQEAGHWSNYEDFLDDLMVNLEK